MLYELIFFLRRKVTGFNVISFDFVQKNGSESNTALLVILYKFYSRAVENLENSLARIIWSPNDDHLCILVLVVRE